MYLIMKVGILVELVYDLSESKIEAIHKCKEYAKNDCDDYHTWVVVDFEPIPTADAADTSNVNYDVIFECKHEKQV